MQDRGIDIPLSKWTASAGSTHQPDEEQCAADQQVVFIHSKNASPTGNMLP
jgi:hypothetical protein